MKVKALESLLVETGLVDPAALDALIDTYENKVGPRNGAEVVARACRTLSTEFGCWKMRRLPSPQWDLLAVRAST